MIKEILKFYKKSDYMRFFIKKGNKVVSVSGKWRLNNDDTVTVYPYTGKVTVPIKDIITVEPNKDVKRVICPLCTAYYPYVTNKPRVCKICGSRLSQPPSREVEL